MCLVASRYFLSHKKDDSCAIRVAVRENHMLHTHFTILCVIDAELLAMEFLMCAEVDSCMHLLRDYLLLTFFGPVTLTLTR